SYNNKIIDDNLDKTETILDNIKVLDTKTVKFNQEKDETIQELEEELEPNTIKKENNEFQDKVHIEKKNEVIQELEPDTTNEENNEFQDTVNIEEEIEVIQEEEQNETIQELEADTIKKEVNEFQDTVNIEEEIEVIQEEEQNETIQELEADTIKKEANEFQDKVNIKEKIEIIQEEEVNKVIQELEPYTTNKETTEFQVETIQELDLDTNKKENISLDLIKNNRDKHEFTKTINIDSMIFNTETFYLKDIEKTMDYKVVYNLKTNNNEIKKKTGIDLKKYNDVKDNPSKKSKEKQKRTENEDKITQFNMTQTVSSENGSNSNEDKITQFDMTQTVSSENSSNSTETFYSSDINETIDQKLLFDKLKDKNDNLLDNQVNQVSENLNSISKNYMESKKENNISNNTEYNNIETNKKQDNNAQNINVNDNIQNYNLKNNNIEINKKQNSDIQDNNPQNINMNNNIQNYNMQSNNQNMQSNQHKGNKNELEIKPPKENDRKKLIRILILLGTIVFLGIIALIILILSYLYFPSNNELSNKPKEQTQKKEKTVLYKNEEFNFSFSYPENWSINENEEDSIVKVASNEDTLSVDINEMIVDVPIDSYIDIINMFGNGDNLLEDTIVSGTEAKYTNYEIDSKNITNWIVKVEKKIYIIEYSVNKDLYEKNKKNADKIVESFKID
ncbi:MAG: hypothetical protein ABF289_03835, partial [Clostridiales bacterium]